MKACIGHPSLEADQDVALKWIKHCSVVGQQFIGLLQRLQQLDRRGCEVAGIQSLTGQPAVCSLGVCIGAAIDRELLVTQQVFNFLHIFI